MLEEVKLDNIRVCYKQNMNAQGFKNVDIYASNPWNANANAKLLNVIQGRHVFYGFKFSSFKLKP